MTDNCGHPDGVIHLHAERCRQAGYAAGLAARDATERDAIAAVPVEGVESILRRYGVSERDIGACCDDLSPHLRPPGSPRGRRYTDPIPRPGTTTGGDQR